MGIVFRISTVKRQLISASIVQFSITVVGFVSILSTLVGRMLPPKLPFY